MEEYSRILAEFVSDYEFDEIPSPALDRSRQSILNCLAAGFAASHEEAVEILLTSLMRNGQRGECQLFGRSERLDLLSSVLVNGFMAHYDDYDDTHRGAGYHTNPSTVPVVLGLGAIRHCNGSDVIAGLALGLEASIRLGMALGSTHSAIGWHTTGTMGTVGAALAASRLMGLDSIRTNHALGLALTQAAGLRGQMFGTMAKGFNAGKGAYNGLLAAILAESSFTSASNGIEGRRAYATAASRNADLEVLTDGLGSRWESELIGFKPYASGASTHATVDAMLVLRRELGLHENSSADEVYKTLGEIEKLQLTMHVGTLSLPHGREISEAIEAKFSVFAVGAIVLVRGRGGPREYNNEVITDPMITHLRQIIELTGDPDVPNGSGFLAAQLRDGRKIDVTIEHALGTAQNPLNDGDLRAKFFDAAENVLEQDAAEHLLHVLEELDQVDDIGEVLDLASGGTLRGRSSND